MPRRGSENEANKRAVTTAGGEEEEEDRLSALPDPILQHVLSFLPSRQAVQTCVLARRWCHQWKSVPALRLDVSLFADGRKLSKFVKKLLCCRHRAPLHECDITADDAQDIPPWIQYALSCRVQVLRVDLSRSNSNWYLRKANLVSDQLVRLELKATLFEAPHFLDFSSCPKLEVLKMHRCLYDSDILSQSLRHLSITQCSLFLDTRTRFIAPGLISLELADSYGLTPVLECMPSLVTASVRLTLADDCKDYCKNSYYGNCGSDKCEESTVHSDDSVLVDGLLNATNLELIADPAVFIFRKDLKKSPSFGKLKTLLLNEWCFAAKFGALVYFLQHSPVLEKLTLQLCETPTSMFKEDSMCYRRQCLASKHLKVVEVKYDEDQVLAIRKVLKILITCGVPSKKIIIERMPSRSSYRFSFEQRAKKFSY